MWYVIDMLYTIFALQRKRSGTLWDPSEGLRDALGRSGSFLEACGTLLDALGAFWRPLGRSGSLLDAIFVVFRGFLVVFRGRMATGT